MTKKKAKVSRPRKKRKHTRRNEKDNFNLLSTPMYQSDKLLTNTVQESSNQTGPSPIDLIARASENSYVFVNGNRVLVRNLSDETLNERYEQDSVATYETRQQTSILENLQWEMSKEQRFRGLK